VPADDKKRKAVSRLKIYPNVEFGSMKMKLKTITVLLITAAALAGIWTDAGAGDRVQAISEKELQELMEGREAKAVLVAVASWCRPCRKELPALNRLFEKYRDQGLSVAAISVDAEGPHVMQPIVDQLALTFPVYWTGQQALRDYNIVAVPTVFIIKNGKTVERLLGQRSEKFLEKKIQKLLE
jgi:thiol-disulfide isomerase/thioredoxin